MSDFYGPALPPGFAAGQSDHEEEEEEEEEEVAADNKSTATCGTQLPSQSKGGDGSVYGPALPPGLGAATSVTTTAVLRHVEPHLVASDVAEANQQKQDSGESYRSTVVPPTDSLCTCGGVRVNCKQCI